MKGAAAVYLTGGTARGAKLAGVPGLDVRPALARLRISLFEILKAHLDGTRVADLFAGTGSLGFEALSRGASFAAFVDRDPRCVEAVTANAKRLRFEKRCRVIRGDALRAPEMLAGLGPLEIVFVDPPYALYDDPESAPRLEAAAAGLGPAGLLAPGAVLCVEHRTGKNPPERWGGGGLSDRRTYGGTTVSIYTVS